MTYAEKYLKDETTIDELCRDLAIYCSPTNFSGLTRERIASFFEQKVKPTLTEDERVILKNIDKQYTHIVRKNDGFLGVTYKEGAITYFWGIAFSDLFQFIKERRKI
jgi:hypothetical protein